MQRRMKMKDGRKPWLKSYDENVPERIDVPDLSLKDLFLKSMHDFKDQAAYHYQGAEFTFGDLLEQSGRFAAALQKNGVAPGNVVAVNLPNTPQYLIAMVGALRAGCVVSGLAPLLTPDEMAFQLNDSGARVLITLDMLYEAKVKAITDKVPKTEFVLVTGPMDFLPGAGSQPTIEPLADKEIASFTAFLADGSCDPASVELRQGDNCFIQYTGGTTGTPKGAILSHGNMVSNIHQTAAWVHTERGRGCWLSAFPMFHVAGLFVACFTVGMGQAQVLIPDPRNLELVTNGIKAHRPSSIGNVPSLAFMLLADETFKKLGFSHLDYWLSGAAPFPVEGIAGLEAVIGEGKLVELWGMTETSPMVTINPLRGTKKPGSVGLPLPNTEVRVVDLDEGTTEVPMGEEGELIVCGPQVMRGYLNKPEETQKALRGHGGRVWMHTGDVGRMDEQGYVYVVDRAKDMIIVGGYKVYSSEVEDKFYQHPVVGACALVGLPNPDRPDSETVKLVVQKSESYPDKPDDEIASELIAFAREKMAPYKVPKIVEFVEAIPMTSVGKIDKKSLRNQVR